MNFFSLKHFLIGTALVFGAGATTLMQPNAALANAANSLHLESLVPEQFGDWRIDSNAPVAIVDPEVNAKLNVLYNQTLSRTYINSQGQQMMLSIAYGNNQNRDFQVHRPEVCYTAQGFVIHAMSKNILNSSAAKIPVMHMVAQQGARTEPVTYWVRIGDDIVRGNLEQALARMRYGLTRQVPDGLLFRISTISASTDKAFSAEQQFVEALLQAVPSDQRKQLIGTVSPS